MSMMNEGSFKKFGDKMLDPQQHNILNQMIRIQGENFKQDNGNECLKITKQGISSRP